MNIEEVQRLLLAAQVREIAIDVRRRAAAVEAKSGRRQLDENFDAFHARFAAEHPLTEYAAQALHELKGIAAAITS